MAGLDQWVGRLGCITGNMGDAAHPCLCTSLQLDCSGPLLLWLALLGELIMQPHNPCAEVQASALWAGYLR